ncbi:hypothetical protein AB0K51_19740 [Kitasatospora sp. NPDC049285]|uniref:hypothetical protein n=1 Tax=Kitasatospora sp. NPDC049285 TaxID=3157096 RepID=UPI003427ECE6
MRIVGERAAATGAVLRWAGHPGTVAAVLLLGFNDRSGKRIWPGPVTGKLSDLAWMLVAPPVLALLLTPVLRLRGHWPAAVGIGGTALAFAVAKSGVAGGELASRIWSLSGVPSRIKGDRSDLLALPVLAVAWWLWRRAHRSWHSRHPWHVRRALAVLTVPLAVAAVVATSAPLQSPPLLTSRDGRPMLRTFDGNFHSNWWTTDDGGLTWQVVPRLPYDLPDADDGPPADQGRCVPAQPLLCYRLLGTDRPIESTQDGGLTWQTAYAPPELLTTTAPSPPQPASLTPSTVDASPAPSTADASAALSSPAPSTADASLASAATDPSLALSAATSSPAPSAVDASPDPEAAAGAPSSSSGTESSSPAGPKGELLVVALPGGGHGVIVNYPATGIAVRTADGRWTTVPVPRTPPWLVRNQPRVHWTGQGLPVALAVGAAALCAALGARALRGLPPGRRQEPARDLAVRQVLVLAWTGAAAVVTAVTTNFVLGWPLALGLSGVVVAVLIAMVRVPSSPRPGAPGTPLLSVVGAVAAAVGLYPFAWWSGGTIDSWWTASALALAFALGATVLGALVGSVHLDPNRRPPRPERPDRPQSPAGRRPAPGPSRHPRPGRPYRPRH